MYDMKKGWLIAFEGIDGTGKTTQIKKLATFIRGMGREVIETREPTDGPYGKSIRELYTNRGKVTREQELELFIKDREQHVRECIQPALERGAAVLTDRYYYSTAAYQGAAGADPEDIFARNHFAPVPDIVILLTMSPQHSIQRIKELRGDTLNDFEQQEQLEKVAVLFAHFTQPEIVRIDALGSIDDVHEQILKEVEQRTSLFSS